MPINVNWGDVASVGVPVAGALAGGWMANRANRGMADTQMRFQKAMRETAYQTAVEDMRKAGLNPMLAYQQGGAVSPGGASAEMSDIISPAVSTAQHARRIREELKLLRAQEFETHQRGGQIGFQNALILQQQRESEARTARENRNAELLGINSELARAELPAARNRARVESSRVGSSAAWLDRIAGTLWNTLPRIGLRSGSRTGRGGGTSRDFSIGVN